MKYYADKDTVKEYIKMAEGHSGLALINRLREYLPLKADVIEIGSGPGTDWRILNKKYDVVGSDNSQEFLNHLRNVNPKGTFLKLNAITISTDYRFDAIYSNKVLHHLTTDELIVSAMRQAEILNEDGVICHSFWLGEGDEYFKEMYVNYHSEQELRNLFGESFKILDIHKYAEFEENDSILLIARKLKQQASS